MVAAGDINEKWYHQRMDWISKFPNRLMWIFEESQSQEDSELRAKLL
jgi:hypothetical protein